MSSIQVTLPDSIFSRLNEIAQKDNVSVNQFIVTALAEKISAFLTEDYLQERAKRASKEKFRKALENVPNVEPEDYDKI